MKTFQLVKKEHGLKGTEVSDEDFPKLVYLEQYSGNLKWSGLFIIWVKREEEKEN